MSRIGNKQAARRLLIMLGISAAIMLWALLSTQLQMTNGGVLWGLLFSFWSGVGAVVLIGLQWLGYFIVMLILSLVNRGAKMSTHEDE